MNVIAKSGTEAEIGQAHHAKLTIKLYETAYDIGRRHEGQEEGRRWLRPSIIYLALICHEFNFISIKILKTIPLGLPKAF